MHRTRASFRLAGLRAVAVSCSFGVVGVVAFASASVLEERVAGAAGGDETLAAALKKFDAGRKAFDAGAFEEALLEYQGSYSLSPSPNSRLYMARCYRALGKVASAYTTFRFAAREAQDRLTATGEKRYTATRDTANAEAGEIEAKVPRLTVAVPGDLPQGFAVKRDGTELTSAAWGVGVETDPGSITVEATGPRLVPFRQTVSLAEGQQLRVEVKVVRVPTAKLALRFKTRPAGIAVTLDDAPLDAASTETPREVDVGNHTVVVNAPGYLPLRWQKGLANGDSAVVEVELKADVRAAASRGTPRWVFFTVAGASIAALGVASVIALNANAQQTSEERKDPFSRSTATRESIRSESTTANVLFVGGGVLAVGAAVLAYTTQWKSETTPGPTAESRRWLSVAGISPSIGSGWGVGANGHF